MADRDPNSSDEELDPSVLGTIDHWKKEYAESIERFEDHGDIGEVWFGKDCMKRIVKWMSNSEMVSKSDDIIDLGCGNAALLIDLEKQGFTNLTGVDYSDEAIQLAQLIKEKENLVNIQLKVQDLLSSQVPTSVYHIAVDKGTYDAISLNPEDPASKRKTYIDNVHTMLKPEGLFIITSCNWTQAELFDHFSQHFQHIESISAPQFSFGGKVGNTVTTLIMKKISR
uniref:Protein-lysine N-methyltransferase n=1 Tax=Cacopsylla melanoneura TaxID=428564 RepID=A0A8D8LB50_9HEMI